MSESILKVPFHKKRPTRSEAESAVRTLLYWAGDDPDREGLKKTPNRVLNAYKECFSGYALKPEDDLKNTFEEISGFNELVLLKNISFNSYCEHHMLPFSGHASVAYLPDRRIVGISKLARTVDIFSRRFQVQEKMTAEICHAIQEALQPRGVAVLVEATHQCMVVRGVQKPGSKMITTQMTGAFRADPLKRQEFLSLIAV